MPDLFNFFFVKHCISQKEINLNAATNLNLIYAVGGVSVTRWSTGARLFFYLVWFFFFFYNIIIEKENVQHDVDAAIV